MKKRTNHLSVPGCLFALLFLAACGANSQADLPAAVSETPAETAAPVETAVPAIVSPTLPPEDPVQPADETAVPEPGSDDGTQSAPDPEPQSAAGSFTGVLGTEFIIPEGFVRLDERPNIGYQYTFWHPEHEIRIVVYEIAPGYVPEGAYETDYSIATRNPDVTYFNSGENWFVQSGYNNGGEEIFYSKESITDHGLITFWISYPTAKRAFGDPVTAEFEESFHF